MPCRELGRPWVPGGRPEQSRRDEGLALFARQDALNNTEIAFVTRNRGRRGVSDFRFLAVVYQLSSTGDIVRRSANVSWSSQNPLQDLASAVGSNSGSILADSVLRLEAVFILEDGTIDQIPDKTEVG